LSYYTSATEFEQALVVLDASEFQNAKLIISTTQSIALMQAITLSSQLIRKSSFIDLCVQNRGASDYAEVCNNCHVLVITDVKQFKPHDFDSAKRLITLVDIAYDQRCKLIIQSDCGTVIILSYKDDLFVRLTEQTLDPHAVKTQIVGRGGSSSSNATTILNDAEWSATGLGHSLADKASSGKRDVYVSFVRAVSRITEMASWK
jgi:protein AFG1